MKYQILTVALGCLFPTPGVNGDLHRVLRGEFVSAAADRCDESYKDETSCLNDPNEECAWCVSAATPEPHCLTTQMAGLLPEGVWKCNSGAINAATSNDSEGQGTFADLFGYDLHCAKMNPTSDEECEKSEACSWCTPKDQYKEKMTDICVPDWMAKYCAEFGIFDCTGEKSETKKLTIEATEDFTAALSGEAAIDTHCITQYTTTDECLADGSAACSWCSVKEQFSGYDFLKDTCYPTAVTGSFLFPLIYDCESPSSDDDGPSDIDEGDFTEGTTSHRYQFVHDVEHVLTDGVVDPKFCDPHSPKSISGYMSLEGSRFDQSGEDKHYFFWMFESREEADENTPFIVWLTGGPGCSSTFALLYENGPCSVNSEGDGTETNPFSWNKKAHMLWLDQPAGVGFSYGEETDRSEFMVGENAYYFLQSFMKTHPEYAHNPLYIVGESYGGHYAPAIAHRIHVGNQDQLEGTMQLNLQGLGIGNGLTNPEIQYQYYADMAFNNSHGIRVVSQDAFNRMKAAGPVCAKLAHKCNESSGDGNPGPIESIICQSAIMYCNSALLVPYEMTGLNPYDIRIMCEHPPLCYDTSKVEKFMNLGTTREALHVTDKSSRWSSCNMVVHSHFTVDWMKNMAPLVSDLLNDSIRVLIYAGDVDFICNYIGNKAWTLDMDWDHKDEFNEADDHDWRDGSGLARTSNGLTFLQVYDAGHMVPMDKPEVALDMINQFTNNEDF